MGYFEKLKDENLSLETPIELYKSENHAIYWIGIPEETAFRCNSYLIVDGEEAIIVDPGNRKYFEYVKKMVAHIVEPKDITGLIVCHQDPDVAASMVDWLDINPNLTIFTTPRTNVLLPHYGKTNYNYYDVSKNPTYKLPSGEELQFIESPFLHFAGAFTTYDKNSKFLFSGDIWAAIDTEWKLIISDFESHKISMDLFHLDYMPSNVICRGYVEKIEDLEIDAILTQHGSIVPKEFVEDAIKYLNELECGADIIYPHLSI